ncbi:Uu.00g134480.m01.CDS01 [Anthostomella pinea]|uniref:Uu.00g134480.m01.CDS01 n=1 Tax=Anthostomella pinea TaxID=933095 RepID=A0AAI8VPL6_9PEZI|nr:Uu.00g134480.m01.CDS01 [Anthostomella pinea]
MATMVEQKVSRAEERLGFTFTVDKGPCVESLNTAGLTFYQGQRVRKNNVLAVHGDIQAAAYLSTLWIGKDGLTKGQWTEIRKLLANENLAQVGVAHGLEECVILNHGTTQVSGGMMATTVEALLGAVHLAGGSEALGRVMARLGLIHNLLT